MSSVNGTSFGLLWKPPYRVDITPALRIGANRLQIKVTNEWNNRILGDQRAPAGQKILASGGDGRGGAGNAQPPESGLIGPVTVMRQTAR